MNAPAHALINLWILRKKKLAWYILAGSLAPDLPMFLFFIYSKIAASPSELMWTELFPLSDWFTIASACHSFALLLPITAAAFIFKRKGPAMFFLSMLIHAVLDFPFAGHDAYQQFFPVSTFQFESPVSYQDLSGSGIWYLVAELAVSTVALVILIKKYPEKRTAAIVSATLYAGFLAYLGLS